MSNLREQYERETGKTANIGEDAESQWYVTWLERRAACAEELAAACMAMRASEWNSFGKAAAALAKYEAADADQ